jgi:hypoxanthine phosphoribosyltransferase
MSNCINILDKQFTICISHQQIEKRVKELAIELNDLFRDRKPVFLSVLNGSFIFASDLMKELNMACEISFIKLSSYTGTSSSGKVSELIGLETNLQNRDVVIIEDIVDTGRTIAMLYQLLNQKKVRSTTLVTMLFKRAALIENITPDYIGFEVEDKFLVGYGLDYNQYGRNLKDIYVENKS